MAQASATPEPGRQFPVAMQNWGKERHAHDVLPATVAEWEQNKAALRKHLLQAWGGFPTEPCALEPQQHGVLERDGYRVEKVTFQTRPGIRMTANAYVPAGEGKRAAVLCVHGHWKGAKQDPVVQSRCIGLVKLGFFVLCVDAFGAGERGLTKNLGEYHGEMVGATLLPIGLPLSGLQVYENMRAVDYLLTRPEVDGARLGITGASGGGNQTMYAGAYDERFQAVVPVCSVGTYQAYLSAACCMCEVVPGGVSFAEESQLLGLVAPRALMVINATRDSFNFSVGEAQKSIAGAQQVFRLYGVAGKISHDIFESGHDYGKEMREAMYGWMTLHLKGEGKGNPIPEPAIMPEDPEALRCFPGDSRPDAFITIPQFAKAQGQQLVERQNSGELAHKEHWEANAERMRFSLFRKVLGGKPNRTEPKVQPESEGQDSTVLNIETEPGITVTAMRKAGRAETRKAAILLDLDGTAAAEKSPWGAALAAAGWDHVCIDLRATGKYAVAGDKIARCPDHNSGEWAMWANRPLLGQWIQDVRTVVDVVKSRWPELYANAALIGVGPAGLVACGTTLEKAWPGPVVMAGTLGSYLTDVPYENQRLGILAPFIVRDVGDIPQIAALRAPQRLVVAGPVHAAGPAYSADELAAGFAPTRKIYDLLGASGNLQLLESSTPESVLAALSKQG